jgi:hypothetical protein
MISRPRYAGPLAALVAATAVLFCTADAHAQFKLRFSNKAGDPEPAAALPLRPNLVQDFYIYVENLNAQAATVKVEIRADGKPVEGGATTVELKAEDKFKQAVFGKPAEKPAEKPATPPPPTPPAAPALAEIKGALSVAVIDAANKVVTEVPLKVANPKDYVLVTKVSFNPTPTADHKNQLRVELKANPDTFAGPRCRVDLVLDPARIPGLVDAKKVGTRGGFLGDSKAELVLTADNLTFQDNKEANGFVYLTIDGWQRAITFSATFPREGTESTPEAVNTPVVRLIAPKQANPGQPVKVTVEADNLGEQVIELGLDRDADGKFSKANGEIVDFAGNRQVKMFFNPAFPGGALQLKPELKDWTHNFEMEEVFGARTLRARLLKNADEAKKDKDEDREIDPNMNKVFGDSAVGKPIFQTVVLDGTPPEGIEFVNMPTQVKRGDSLTVNAKGFDPESGIKEVLFFVGKLDKDGKLPPNAIQAPGKLIDPEKGIWTADLDAPTDQKGKFEVTALFLNAADMPATATVKIELIDGKGGGGGGGGGKASIQGKLVDGTGRPQGKGVLVELRDDKGAVKDTTKTDEKSEYAFKDVAPGTYIIAGVRTANNTKGATTVQVKDGDKRTDVDVKLSR